MSTDARAALAAVRDKIGIALETGDVGEMLGALHDANVHLDTLAAALEPAAPCDHTMAEPTRDGRCGYCGGAYPEAEPAAPEPGELEGAIRAIDIHALGRLSTYNHALDLARRYEAEAHRWREVAAIVNDGSLTDDEVVAEVRDMHGIAERWPAAEERYRQSEADLRAARERIADLEAAFRSTQQAIVNGFDADSALRRPYDEGMRYVPFTRELVEVIRSDLLAARDRAAEGGTT